MALPDGESWLYRPMLRGCCRYTDLIDGTLDLYDVACMNEALDVEDENQRRYYAALDSWRNQQ